jgi:hypothetical protein
VFIVPARGLALDRSQYFVADGSTTVFLLKPAALIAGSDSVRVDGRLLDRREYILDADAGLLWVKLPARTFAGVRLDYRSAGRVSAGVADIPGLPGQGASEPDTTRTARDSPLAQGDELDLSGDKLIAVTAGGGRSGIDQITNVSASGSVSGWTIRAELSDQSSPIPIEGTTRELLDVDRVFVDFAGRGWRGHLGDSRVSHSLGVLGSIDRDVFGAVLARDSGRVTASAAYGVPRGEYGDVAVSLIEGVRGPYRLTPVGAGVRVIPGSEEVLVDGRTLARGWDADYVFDYDAAELSFTNRPMLSADSRVDVRFQYSTDAYRRNIVSASGAYRSGALDFTAGVLREGDDPRASLLVELTDADRERLAAVTTDSSAAWLDGIERVRPGDGDYVLEGDHYRYVGAGGGDYRIRFSFVGQDRGRYVYDDTIYAYRYVGDSVGTYEPLVRVLLPTRNDIATGRVTGRFGPLRIALDGVGLRRGRNLFAPGGAVSGEGAAGARAELGDSSLSVSYERQMRTPVCNLPMRYPDADFAFRWGADVRSLPPETDELTCRWRPDTPFLGVLALGRATGASGQRLTLLDGMVDAGPAHVWLLRNSCAERWGIELSPTLAWAQLSATFATSESFGLRRSEVYASFRADPRPKAGAGLGYRRSWVATAESGLLPGHAAALRQSISSSAGWEAASWRASAVGNLVLPASADDTLNPQARLDGSLSAAWFPAFGLRLQGDVSQSLRRQPRYIELFNYVGSGKGDYEKDSVGGGYFPMTGGRYVRLTVPSGSFATGTERALAGSGELTALGPLVVTATVNNTQTSSAGEQYSASTALNLRTRVSRPLGGLTPGAGMDIESRAEPGMPATGRARSQAIGYVESGFAAARGLFVQARAEAYERRGGQGGSLAGVVQQGAALDVRPDISGLGDGRLRLEARRLTDGGAGSDTSVPLTALAFGVGRSVRLGRATRVRLDAGATYRWASGDVPYQLAATEPLGLTPEGAVSLEVGLAERLRGAARYTLSDRPDRAPEHVVEVSLRATF